LLVVQNYRTILGNYIGQPQWSGRSTMNKDLKLVSLQQITFIKV